MGHQYVMERLELTAAEVQSGGTSSGGGGGGARLQYPSLLCECTPWQASHMHTAQSQAVTCLFLKWINKREAGCLNVLYAQLDDQAGKVPLVTSWILVRFGWNYLWMYLYSK